MFIFKYLYGVIDCYLDVKNTGQFCPVFYKDSVFYSAVFIRSV